MIHKEKIFCALDFSEINETQKFIKKITKYVGGIKIGLEFFLKNGPTGVKEIKKNGIPLFLDLKLKDIPNTVKKATENIVDLEPDFLSVHITGGLRMLQELIAVKQKIKILGVSMLTSLDQSDLKSFGIRLNNDEYVEKLCLLGIKAGIDGLVSSASEVRNLKKKIKDKILFVTPGVRLKNNLVHDQKRVVSPGEAIKAGSSILVIGREITHSKSPIDALKKISDDIEVNVGS